MWWLKKEDSECLISGFMGLWQPKKNPMHRVKACWLGHFLLPVIILDELRSAKISAVFGVLLCYLISAVSSGVDSSLSGIKSSNLADSWEAAGLRFLLQPGSSHNLFVILVYVTRTFQTQCNLVILHCCLS